MSKDERGDILAITAQTKAKNLFQNMTIMGLLKWISLFLHVIIWNDAVCCISSLQLTPEGKLLGLKQETMKSADKTEPGAREFFPFYAVPCLLSHFCSILGQKRTWRLWCFVPLMAHERITAFMASSIVSTWVEGRVRPWQSGVTRIDGMGKGRKEGTVRNSVRAVG